MLFGFVDRTTQAQSLKSALDAGNERMRGIADRVSKASVQNGDGFALQAKPGQAGTAGANDINIEDEMASLGDEQLRYLATTRLLEKTYQSLRTAIKGTV